MKLQDFGPGGKLLSDTTITGHRVMIVLTKSFFYDQNHDILGMMDQTNHDPKLSFSMPICVPNQIMALRIGNTIPNH